MTLAYIDAKQLREIATPQVAVAALEAALRSEIDPERDSPRLFSPAPAGEFLLMPTAGTTYSGVKVVTIAPENPAKGHPKIQGTYLLFDSATLAPIALMDGAELTLIRTPATSVLAIKHMLAADPRGARTSSGTVIVFGAGPQAWNHIETLAAIAPPTEVLIVGRRAERVNEVVGQCTAAGISARAATADEVSKADVVICVTSSSVPVFDGALVADHAVVAAVGSHGLDARELEADLVRRADVVVESRAGAMREGGDLIPARSPEEWAEHQLTNLAELVAGGLVRRAGHPAVYSGVGMAWQDIVTAAAVYEQTR
ncbi:ornithine cyclodeaminase family protein [Lysinibacter cavernae]|uniref:Ornithine cyclodeaminase n=1 Tax=Lysinibacter cavernae TaxID=1640652 RepID=A0A7X5R258_9MICO|nr:ornithine cyclodeaminase family protein [Lysinibacter cavernae]NIH54300.1 ornithine cyclodeaminase [Lysinibacter cavernae]